MKLRNNKPTKKSLRLLLRLRGIHNDWHLSDVSGQIGIIWSDRGNTNQQMREFADYLAEEYGVVPVSFREGKRDQALNGSMIF